MELAFATKSLRQLCENEARAKRDLGETVAERLKRRLADLRAAECVKDLVAGHPREVEGMEHPNIAMNLCKDSHIAVVTSVVTPKLLWMLWLKPSTRSSRLSLAPEIFRTHPV